MALNNSSYWLDTARDHWNWRGQARPPFAIAPGPDQVFVCDFPRPPRPVSDPREVAIYWTGTQIARTTGDILVLETAHPPSFYIPWADVNRALLQPSQGSSFCNGRAQRVTGPWSMGSTARRNCPVWPGATPSHLKTALLAQRRWPTALRFTRRIWTTP